MELKVIKNMKYIINTTTWVDELNRGPWANDWLLGPF